jgi:hypothetical protein
MLEIKKEGKVLGEKRAVKRNEKKDLRDSDRIILF